MSVPIHAVPYRAEGTLLCPTFIPEAERVGWDRHFLFFVGNKAERRSHNERGAAMLNNRIGEGKGEAGDLPLPLPLPPPPPLLLLLRSFFAGFLVGFFFVLCFAAVWCRGFGPWAD